MDYKQIGQRIRKLRRAHGLSQEELASRVNISTTHMSHIETGGTKLSLPVLVDIAAALEVPVDDLLTNCLSGGTHAALEEIADILEGCTAQEARVLVDILRAAKQSMEKHF